ncbi:glutathione S-transferase [Bosea caraganae]|uniref:Glutathione S-transferase n=1 Tax=Bosea caraganae TaxID=2763117 RepID=A0A370LA75_9HYPH|nr:glutathione S-transferase N-terminal domain-containing protein [Bosea caraganae]RDJ21898.1 glutathione S-transferase [Bosea caraganae]RDJ28070.1 glutathione S-transferase [Bosea caraganae]
MKLYWSPRSPYVRKVMVVAHEKGVADRIERLPIVVSGLAVSEDFHAVNPLARIPTLILDDGASVYDSTVIAEYLDTLSPQNPLLPAAPGERLAVQSMHALGTGIADLLIPLRGELARPEAERSATFMAVGVSKFALAADRLEAMAGGMLARPIDLGQIAVATALTYADFRFPHLDWRQGRPGLTAWFDAITQRPSFRATAFVDA